MKNGFTLVEVIAVITIIALLGVISITTITSRINNKKSDINETQKALILTATELYVSDNKLLYSKKEGNVYCIPVELLIQDKYLSSPIVDVSGKEIDYSTIVKAYYLNANFSFEYAPENCSDVK